MNQMPKGLFGREIRLVSQPMMKDGPNTPGQPRKTAYEGDGIWVGQTEVTASDIPSQWHHHEN